MWASINVFFEDFSGLVAPTEAMGAPYGRAVNNTLPRPVSGTVELPAGVSHVIVVPIDLALWSWTCWTFYSKVHAPRDAFPIFRLEFLVFQSLKTISSIKIDGYGSISVKLEKPELVKPKTRKRENGKLKNWKTTTEKLKNCKSEKLQNRKLAKPANGGHDSIQTFGSKNSFSARRQ